MTRFVAPIIPARWSAPQSSRLAASRLSDLPLTHTDIAMAHGAFLALGKRAAEAGKYGSF
jgi:hypothetical protein